HGRENNKARCHVRIGQSRRRLGDHGYSRDGASGKLSPRMRIIVTYNGAEKAWETHEMEVVFGRSDDQLPVMLDLSPDQRVSRLHGRIWEEAGAYWMEDLNSTRGTQINGVEIKGRGKQPLQLGDSVLVGQTTLQLQQTDAKEFGSKTS